MKNKIRLALVAALVFVLPVTALPQSSNFAPTVRVNQPPQGNIPAIIDTDLAPDYDDAGAITLAAALVLRKELSLLGVMTNSSNIYSAPTAKAILVANGLTTIPVYAYQGNDMPASSVYTQQVTTRFRPGDTRANYTEPVQGYCTLLDSAPNLSVTIISIGFLQNIANLMQANCSGFSSQTGLQLVTSKVKSLWIMGGDYPSGTAEFNFASNPVATAYVFNNWPGTIIAQGFSVGNTILTNQTGDPLVSPTAYAYSLGGGPRNSWDPMAVLSAIRSYNLGLSNGGLNGTNAVNTSNGNNTWTSTTKNTTWQNKTMSDAVYATTINALMNSAF